MTATKDYTIRKTQKKPDALNYEQLRQYGLDYISRLGGKLWSDYNLHDPGITTLELLCYALTDLGYRTSFDMKDILTPKEASQPEMNKAFIPAHEILPSAPLTITDYRKLILEHIPAVKNVRIETEPCKQLTLSADCLKDPYTSDNSSGQEYVSLNGFYSVYVQMADFEVIREYADLFGKDESGNDLPGYPESFSVHYKDYCARYIWNFLMSHRNLCEDFSKVTIMDTVGVGICADIEVKPEADHQVVIQEACRKISAYISPSLPYYSLEQMLDKGKTVEEIYQGVFSGRGFIDTEELTQFKNKNEIYNSDVINLIMSIEGVSGVKHFHFIPAEAIAGEKLLDGSHKFSLKDPDVNSFCFVPKTSVIVISRGAFSFKAEIESLIEENEDTNQETEDQDSILPLPSGRYREINNYFSIQDEYPKTYRLGKEGIDRRETNLRKAQRLQFKAYLLFFDQLLADYLSQLTSVKELFSWNDTEATYFFKQLTENEITGFMDVFDGYGSYSETLESETIRKNRKNRFLNHLIARFNEEFVDFSLNKYRDVAYTTYLGKKRFLDDYTWISGQRTRALNYIRKPDAVNVNMLETRIYSKLGLNTALVGKPLVPESRVENDRVIFKDNRKNTFDTDFGLHVYEHILFHPVNGKANKDTFLRLAIDFDDRTIVKDPYSMKITVVAPGWLACSQDYEFRKFIEDTILREAPAHVIVKICWLDPYQMYQLESVYEKYLSVLSRKPYTGVTPTEEIEKWEGEYDNVLSAFIKEFSTLQSIYLPIILYSGETRVTDYSAILNYSFLPKTVDDNLLWGFEMKENTDSETENKS